MRLLDLFCGAGGAGTGYHRAGFEVVGVDCKPQKHYPFEFHQADAFEYLANYGHLFHVIHASPPCQAYTNQGKGRGHPMLIDAMRELILRFGRPYIIENVIGAPLRGPIVLCGSMFNLGVRRHRKFESNCSLRVPQLCMHEGHNIRAYYGAWGREAFRAKKPGNKDTLRGTVERAPTDMGIDWMDWKELTQSIPPAYTEWIGQRLMEALRDTR
jgi:DNA (cytosine-5)-methyltransferase 1